MIAVQVAESVVESLRPRFEGVVSALPQLSYGLSQEHAGLPNTAYVTHTAYYTFVYQLLDSLAEDRDLIVVINGHGGNVNTLNALEADFNYAHGASKVFFPQLFSKTIKSLSDELFGEFDAHAGSVEASLLAFYQDAPASEYEVQLPRKIRGTFRFVTTSEMTPHGVIKQLPSVIADPTKGERVHRKIVDETVDSIHRLAVELGNFIEG